MTTPLRQAVLGLDAGTSSLKAGLLTLAGEPLALAEAAYPLASPEPGAMEQDARDWWAALVSTSREVIDRTGSVELLALAVAGQAPALVAVDADLQPTHAAITWLDRRPAEVAEELYARLGQAAPAWGSWPAQAAWLARERPAAIRRARHLLGCPDYLAARLSGQPALFLEWSAAELDAAGVDQRLLPAVCPPGAVVGSVTPAAAEATGVPKGTPVVAGFIDGVMGVLGSGAMRVGDACLNGGTSGTFSVLVPPGGGYPVLGMHVAGAATNTSGKALDWFAEHVVHHQAGYAALLEQAAAVPPGSGGLLFLPHLAGQRGPLEEARARGAWVGLSLEHDWRHLLRAILEGVAFSFRALGQRLVDGGAHVGELRCVGGQARSPLWNQIKADVLGRPLLVPDVAEAAVVGAAMVAALAMGAYPSPTEAALAMVRAGHRYEPDPLAAAVYDDLYGELTRIDPALRQASRRLHELRL